MKKKECVIYKMTCLANNRVYIGQSKDWRKRWNEHKRNLRNSTHRSKKLQRAWDKYGADQFVHTILEYCHESDLDEREVFWIAEYDAMNKYKGFNNESGGTTNKIMSEEARKNISNAQKEVYHRLSKFYLNSPEANEKRRIAHIGMKRSESTKKKISEKAKLRVGEKNHFYGRSHSEETINKISQAKKGVLNPKKYKPLIATHLKTGETLYFESRLEAEKHGFRRGGISQVLKGNAQHYKGYVFRNAQSHE